MSFDPARHLTDLKGKEYLEVKWRLVWLRDTHPDAIIETELVELSQQSAVFKARVSIPGGGSATGFGTETPGDFRDYVEKAETKAIGRALGALGYGTQFAPDFDFGAEQGRVVDSPVNISRAPAALHAPPQRTTVRQFTPPGYPQPQAAPSGGTGNGMPYPPSERQWGYLKGLAASAFNQPTSEGRDQYLLAWADQRYDGVTSLDQLNKQQVSQMIEHLKDPSEADRDRLRDAIASLIPNEPAAAENSSDVPSLATS